MLESAEQGWAPRQQVTTLFSRNHPVAKWHGQSPQMKHSGEGYMHSEELRASLRRMLRC